MSKQNRKILGKPKRSPCSPGARFARLGPFGALNGETIVSKKANIM